MGWDRSALVLAVALAGCGGGSQGAIDARAGDADARTVEGESLQLTWVGVTTWLLEYQGTALLLDAYFSRAPFGELGGDAEGEQLLATVLDEAGVASLSGVLVGHSHFDHSFDIGAATRADAHIYGSATTCYLAATQGVASDGCTVVDGGDRVTVGEFEVRVIRLPHSLPASLGSYEELTAPPPAPLSETSVPVGAELAYHVEVANRPELSLLFYDSFAPLSADDGSGQDFAANLTAAYAASARPAAWLVGVFSGLAALGNTEQHVADYLAVIDPAAVIAHHWDDLGDDPSGGLSAPFEPPAIWTAATNAAGIWLVAPTAYFDRIEIDAAGVHRPPAATRRP